MTHLYLTAWADQVAEACALLGAQPNGCAWNDPITGRAAICLSYEVEPERRLVNKAKRNGFLKSWARG